MSNELNKMKEEMLKNEAESRRVGLGNEINDQVCVPSELFDRGKHLSSQAKLLYITLKSFADDEAVKIFVSYKQLRFRSGLTRDAVAKRLEELEHFGWLERIKSRGERNAYMLRCPALDDAQIGNERDDRTQPTKESAKAWALARKGKADKKH